MRKVLSILALFSLLAIGNCEKCILISKGTHGKVEVYGFGLHRQLKTSVFIQSQQRVPQCRLLYKLEFPEGVYIDERELNSSTPGYQFIVIPNGKQNVLYAIRQKLFLSTFEMKETLNIKFHLHPPSKSANLDNLQLKLPSIAVDCKGNNFDDCTGLKVSNDARLKPAFRRWLIVPGMSDNLSPEIQLFREGKILDDYPSFALFVLIGTLTSSIIYLIK